MSIHFHNKGILMNFTKKAACVFLVVGSIILLFCNLIVSADTKISSLRQDNVNDKLYSEINSFSLKTSTTPLGQKILNLAISKIDPKIIYASTPHGIFKSLDQTKSWIPLLNQPPFGKIVGLMVAGNNPNLVFGFTKSPNNNLLFVTRDGGENWKVSVDPIFKNSLEPMCATSNDEALYIAADKVIYKSLDNGQTWVAFFPTGLTASIRLLVFDPKTSKNLYVVDKENKILKSIDDGVSWQVLSKVNTKHKITSLAIDPFNPNTLYIGLNKRGGLYYSQDGGNKWLPLVGKLANTSITAIAIDKQTYSLYVSTKKRLFVIDINPQACTTTPITSGQIINGNLQNDDCKSMDRGNSFFADRYTFSGQAGQRIDILITEANFDTFLILYSPTNNRIASDDDNGVGNLARLSFTLPTTGTYTFEVTSSSSSGTGTYSVRTNIGCLAAPSQSGQIINGSLTGDECKPMTESDRFADGYTFSGQAGQRIDISIIEANFDTFLILYSPTGNPIASNDDGGIGNLARLSFTLPTTGTYIFEVTSSSSSGTGTYSVRTNIGCLAAPSQSGQIINGSLTGDECKPMTESDRFADGYTFSGQAGQRIDISIIEANFDTFLILYSPTGNPIASDDDSGVGNLARLSFTLPTTGTYTFEVTSSSTLVTGNYVVKLVIGEDYALSFSPSSLTIKRGETGTSILNINRINGFSDAVTITPPNTKPLKIKLTPSTPQSTTSTNLSFTYKTKKTSPLGTQQLSFTGVDSSGKTRTAIINLIIQ